MFYIKVKDENIPNDPGYTLDAFIETDSGYTNVYIGDTHNRTRMNTCVRFVVEEGDPEALLEDFNTRQSCDINHSLQEGSGTRRLLMGALKFLMETYAFVQYVNLSDVAQKKGTRVYLTPKRLLLGKPGWYEAHFGATPTHKTKMIQDTVLKEISLILTPEKKTQIAKQSWGTSNDLETLSQNARKLIHNDWVIAKETIQSYPVKIHVLTKISGGASESGGEAAFLRLIKRAHTHYINNQFKAVQLKYGHV